MQDDSKKKRETLSEAAYQAIKRDITQGKLRPGDVLGEERLCEELAVSRTPIRAALQRLVYEGLAQTDDNKSVRVLQVTQEDIVQITQVRRELETLAVRLLKDKLTPEGIRRLRHLCDEEKRLAAVETADYLALIDRDYDLHVALAELTGNQFLLDTMKRMKTKSSQFLVLSGTMKKYGITGVGEHEEIIGFLESGQYDYAEVAIRNHINAICDRILE